MSPPLPLESLAKGARLLQLASQALPTGAFAYSGGLETAHARSIIADEDSGRDFLASLLLASPTHLELPIFLRMYDAFTAGAPDLAAWWSRYLLASRESLELQEQDRQMARALERVLLAIAPEACDPGHPPTTFPEALARAARHYELPREDAALLSAYTWIEQHTTALSRLLPLGPLASQRVVDKLLRLVPTAIAQAMALTDEEIGFACPKLALFSAWHETEYCRVFRS